MNCQQIARLLSASQDGELANAQEREVQLHLRDCPSCREERDGLQQLNRRLRLVPPPGTDPFFPARVMASLPTRPAAKYRLLQAAAYALALVIVFTGGFLLQTGAGNRASTVPAVAATFSAVLLEPQDLGLLSVQDATLGLFTEAVHE